jgi:hypothetical protein
MVKFASVNYLHAVCIFLSISPLYKNPVLIVREMIEAGR